LDNDGDGLSNLAEFRANTDRLTPELPQAGIDRIMNLEWLLLRFFAASNQT